MGKSDEQPILIIASRVAGTLRSDPVLAETRQRWEGITGRPLRVERQFDGAIYFYPASRAA